MCKYIFSLLIVAAAMLLATPGTEARFYIDIPDVETNCIPANTPLTINVKMNNITGENVIGMANGFRIYSPEGAVWQVPTVSSEIGDYFDLVFAINGFSVDGSGADTIGLTGVAVTAPGVPNGYDDVVLVINTQVEESEIGKTFCIDSSWFPPMGSWQWVTPSGTVIPEWEGPYCYIIYPSLATIEG
ncbi:MAG: hypothetical protein KAW46_06730, partial [candidate division Zixibacteria bacterium]|nr:hypothetical protein [candidate division Zixibacteria bacterium]